MAISVDPAATDPAAIRVETRVETHADPTVTDDGVPDRWRAVT
ncbi:hypothetical protein [Actinomadura sp. 9N407]